MQEGGPLEPDPLKPVQLAEAVALWRAADRLRAEGVGMALLSLNRPLRLRPVGRPFDIIVNTATLSTT